MGQGFSHAAGAAGRLRVFTAREGTQLVGYAVYLLAHAPHYRSSLQASHDLLYLKPESRGSGLEFILWCAEQLKREGVQVVQEHVKPGYEKLAEALVARGYEKLETVYVRRLDG